MMLVITGDWSRGEGPRMAERVMDVIAFRPTELANDWFGLKHYAHWSHQAFTCTRGYVPKHYHSIVARIEATPEVAGALRAGWRPSVLDIVRACDQVRQAVRRTEP